MDYSKWIVLYKTGLSFVTCTITCYSEGKAVQNTVLSLLEQVYSGHIEIIAAVDGVKKNLPTYHALKELLPLVKNYANRSLVILPKVQRGGRVSSLNARKVKFS